MAQISRPFQVVLAAFVLFAIAWFALLHRPGTSSTGSSAPASAAAVHPHAPAHAAATAPAHATAKTHARTVQTHATTVTHHGASTVATHATTVTGHGTSVTHRTTTVTRSAAKHHHASLTVHHTSVTHTTHRAAAPAASHKAATDPHRTQPAQHGAGAGAKSTGTPAMQATVAAELKQHKVVLLLFWNPSSSSDAAVHRQVQIVARKLGRSVAVHTSAASQVGSYGTITRDIQIYQTPTLLVVNPHGQVTTVTGYTEAYALEQTIREARG
jgi:hypothetical protein